MFGAYFDFSPADEFYIPNLGATFILNDHWSVNAVMPWPKITYVPDVELFMRLRIASFGTSWSMVSNARHPQMSLNAWNFGFNAQRRVPGSLWLLGLEIGNSGLRRYSTPRGEWEPLKTDLDHRAFAASTVNFSPAVLTGN
jgi:hypothetical protein